MIRLRWGTVVEARAAHPGLTELVVTVDGEPAPAVAYDALVGRVSPGDRVFLNTTAVALRLGTGGVHFVVAVHAPRGDDEPLDGHAMKLRYTPLQTAVAVVEETHVDAIDGVTSLGDTPVVVAGMHSALAPAAIGIRAAAPRARVCYVMTDGAALPLAFSRTVAGLRAAGLLDISITAGQAFGGDLEAVTVFGALAAARAVSRADAVIVAMGPGNLGTGSRWGSAALEVGQIVNAVAAFGGTAIVAPRISFADPRDRHRGVSHHTRTALEHIALARARIAVPTLAPERAALVREQLARAAERHEIVEVDLGEAEQALAASPVRLESMGRGLGDDPDYFRAAAAAGVLAARALGA